LTLRESGNLFSIRLYVQEVRETIDAIWQGTNGNQAIALAPQMCWRAAPRPIGIRRSQLRLDGIQSHVAESAIK